jgi:hypothetical protein
LANVDLAVLIDDDLDLQPEVPSNEKHHGIRRKSASRRKTR